MHISFERPFRPAVICGETGETISYSDLLVRSNRLARFFIDRYLKKGDVVAVLLPNCVEYFDAIWMALRSGIQIVPININAAPTEINFILKDCGAKGLISTQSLKDVLIQLEPFDGIKLLVKGKMEGWESYAIVDYCPFAGVPPGVNEDGGPEAIMCYSSGTTSTPKGVKLSFSKEARPRGFASDAYKNLFRINDDTVFLTPAPLFYSGAVYFTTTVHRLGGTVVFMSQPFSAERTLEAMERYHVTHARWVPTMFVKALELPKEERNSFDLSALVMGMHGGAPCPGYVKGRMIEWWGDKLIESYGSTESMVVAMIHADEWTRKTGSVGKVQIGKVHVCSSSGEELDAGQEGIIYFENPDVSFEYTNRKLSEASRHPICRDWRTVGDVGYVDVEGYLYLTDRLDFMIISGGVNIYPRAIEEILLTHPEVEDCAVIGTPHKVMGEVVTAIVVAKSPSAQLKRELREFTKNKVARFAVPRHVEFVDKLPYVNGKVNKQQLKKAYS